MDHSLHLNELFFTYSQKASLITHLELISSGNIETVSLLRDITALLRFLRASSETLLLLNSTKLPPALFMTSVFKLFTSADFCCILFLYF